MENEKNGQDELLQNDIQAMMQEQSDVKLPGFLEDGRIWITVAFLIIGVAMAHSIFTGATSWQKNKAKEAQVATQEKADKK